MVINDDDFNSFFYPSGCVFLHQFWKSAVVPNPPVLSPLKMDRGRLVIPYPYAKLWAPCNIWLLPLMWMYRHSVSNDSVIIGVWSALDRLQWKHNNRVETPIFDFPPSLFKQLSTMGIGTCFFSSPSDSQVKNHCIKQCVGEMFLFQDCQMILG